MLKILDLLMLLIFKLVENIRQLINLSAALDEDFYT